MPRPKGCLAYLLHRPCALLWNFVPSACRGSVTRVDVGAFSGVVPHFTSAYTQCSGISGCDFPSSGTDAVTNVHEKDRAPEDLLLPRCGHETSGVTSHANRSIYQDRGIPARTTLTSLLFRCHPIIVAGELGKHAPMRKGINSGDGSAGGADVRIHPGITNEGAIVLYQWKNIS